MNEFPRRRHRSAVSIAVIATAMVIVAIPTHAVLAAACWSPPVSAVVVDPFREPACRRCPGNRGLEYDTRAGTPVRAVASGQVTFAGSVAGTGYVVVRHADGRRVTYGNLADRRVDRGDTVVRGSLVGVAAGRFHLGVREGETYVDPAPFIGVLRGVLRLIPADGTAPAPAPPPRLVCGRHADSREAGGARRSRRFRPAYG